MEWWMIFPLGLIVLGLACAVGALIWEHKTQKRFKENARAIRPGMLKLDVINLMGKKYSHSYLQNDVEKLEWRYHESGGGVNMNGVFVFEEGETKRICVIFQHGVVIEVHTQNLD